MTLQRHEHWRVSVEASGEHIVSIEPEMLAGREISEADEQAIRTAAHHLLAFIGDPSPAPAVNVLGASRTDIEHAISTSALEQAERRADGTIINGGIITSLQVLLGMTQWAGATDALGRIAA